MQHQCCYSDDFSNIQLPFSYVEPQGAVYAIVSEMSLDGNAILRNNKAGRGGEKKRRMCSREHNMCIVLQSCNAPVITSKYWVKLTAAWRVIAWCDYLPDAAVIGMSSVRTKKN